MEEEGTWLKWEGGQARKGTTHTSGGDHTGIFAVFLLNWTQALMLTLHKVQVGNAGEKPPVSHH